MGIDRPDSRIVQLLAFDGVLRRHHDASFGERGKGRAVDCRVILQREFCGGMQTRLAQRPEKAFRHSNTRGCGEGLVSQARDKIRQRQDFARLEMSCTEQLQLHDDSQWSLIRRRPVGDDRGRIRSDLRDDHIDRRQARGGLAQRTRRQQKSVANTPIVLHDDFNVACKILMLQSVIADDDVDIRP